MSTCQSNVAEGRIATVCGTAGTSGIAGHTKAARKGLMSALQRRGCEIGLGRIRRNLQRASDWPESTRCGPPGTARYGQERRKPALRHRLRLFREHSRETPG